MSFFTLQFVLFLSALFFAWWLVPQKARPFLLAGANLVFSVLLGQKAFFTLILVSAIGYCFDLLVGRFKKALPFWLGVLGLLTPLALYKYLPVLAGHFAWAAPFSQLAAALGISFYTFKSLALLIEVYRGSLQPVKNPLLYFAYIGFFPQLPMGPIQRPEPFFSALSRQPRHLDSAQAINACTRICWALFLKKCLADPLSTHYGAMRWADYGHPPAVLASLVFYSLYLYFDFAAYSQLAIAFGELLGLPCAENFKSPYFSRSLGEFWRRWHISLSSFLRDAVYIPLGGSRNGTGVLILATMATFLVSGVWHGSTGGFLVWGALHGVWLLIGRATRPLRERFWQKRGEFGRGPVRSVLGWAFTMLLVGTGWFFFCAGTLPQAFALAAHLFQPFSPSVLLFKESLTQLDFTPALLLQLALFLVPAVWIDWRSRETGFGPWAQKLRPWMRVVLCYFCLFSVIFFGAGGALPGVYFQF